MAPISLPKFHVTDSELLRLPALLRLERPLLFVDLETTGVDPDRDRIVEIATLHISPASVEVHRWRTLVNPGCRIPAEATAVHGIGDADVANAQPFAAHAAGFARELMQCDVAGFGVRRFDLRMLAAECARAGCPFDPEAVRVIDVMEVFYRMEPRTLAGATRFYLGEDHTAAHGALADVEATAAVLVAQLDAYAEAPRTVAELSTWAEDRDPAALDHDGKIVWRGGDACIAFGKHLGTPLRRVDKSYLRWMLEQTFGTSTKRIVADALRGVYPAALGSKSA